jgi:integrase
MARTVGRLTALKVVRLKKPGLYADGAGLYLQITGDGKERVARSWLFRFTLKGRVRDMGLGPLATLNLGEAREAARQARKLCQAGIDPIDARKARIAGEKLAAAKGVTFKECASAYIGAHKSSWRNAKHLKQWEATLKTYAEPHLGALTVGAIDTGMILKVLEPIWQAKTETAKRLRGRMEAILDWAKTREYRSGENPARWRGHLENLLAKPSKVRRVEHHAALPYVEAPKFMAALKAQGGTAARALEFTVLTAARSNETLGARWPEFDLDAGIWTVPAERMKAGREHRVALSDAAVALVKVQRSDDPEFVFPGGRAKHPLSNMAMAMVLRRMKRSDLTVHGFRSTFRDWCAERTNYPSEVAEMALAHVVGDKVEAAYRRGDLFEKRRRLAEDWATFCAKGIASGDVVPMRRKKA